MDAQDIVEVAVQLLRDEYKLKDGMSFHLAIDEPGIAATSKTLYFKDGELFVEGSKEKVSLKDIFSWNHIITENKVMITESERSFLQFIYDHTYEQDKEDFYFYILEGYLRTSDGSTRYYVGNSFEMLGEEMSYYPEELGLVEPTEKAKPSEDFELNFCDVGIALMGVSFGE